MNSASHALVWEIWRRNRVGWVILAGLFAVCAALTWAVGQMAQKAAYLEAHNPNVFTLSADKMLSSSGNAAGPGKVVLQFKKNTIFEGIVRPGDQFTVMGLFGEGGGPAWRITLNNPVLNLGMAAEEPWSYDGQSPLNPTLSWTAADGRTGTLTPAFDPEYPSAVALARNRADQWGSYLLVWSVGLFMFSVFTLFAIFGLAEPSTNRGFTGIPPRRFTLPVGTGTLVGWPMALGAVTISLTYLVWSRWVFQPLTVARGSMPDLYLVLLLCAGLTCFQALVWGLPSFPKLRASFLTLLVLGSILFAAVPFDRQANASEPAFSGLFALVWGASAAAAWFGVRLERSGFWSGWTRSSLAADSFRLVLPRTIRFAGPLHAQCWMEWRRNGRFAAAVLMALFALMALCAIVTPFGSDRMQVLAGALMPLFIIATVGWVGISGLNLARDGASKALALSSFTAVRPLPTGALVEAKLTIGLVIWGVFAVGLTFVWVVLALLNAGRWNDSIVIWGALLALSAHMFVGILPLCLAGRIAGFPWSFLPWLLVYGALANAAIWFGEHPNQQWALFWILTGGLLLKLGAAVRGFGRSLQAGLVSPVFVVVCSVVWILVTAALVHVAYQQAERLGWGESETFIAGMTLVIPLARIAWAPVALAGNRHR